LRTIVKRVFPGFAVALVAALLLPGDGTLAILGFVACIVAIPLIYGQDVDEIARATREGDFDH
jgi:hypothetical protein